MRYILTFTFLFSFSFTFAQTDWNYDYIDSLTYEQYVNNDLKSLKITVKKAFKNEVDFYYLRMRLAILYYNDMNYEKGLIHFKKAYEMNPADPSVQEYYYYSLLNTLRTADAHDLAETFSSSLQDKIEYDYKKVIDLATSTEAIAISTGIIQSDNDPDYDFIGDAIYAETTLQNNTIFGSVYLKNRVNNRLKFMNSFSFYNTSSLGIVQSVLYDTEEREFTNDSYNFVIACSYEFEKQFHINGFLSYYHEKSNYFTSEIDLDNLQIIYTHNPYNNKAISGGVSIFKRIHNFGLGLDLVTGNLGNVKQYQAGGSFLLYPFGNTNFFSKSSGTFLLNNDANQIIITQSFGGLIFGNLRFNLNGSYGNHHNYISDNGATIFNTIDPILIKGEASLIYKLGKTSIIPSYGYQQRERSHLKLIDFDTSSIIKNQYNNHILKLTLLWNF